VLTDELPHLLPINWLHLTAAPHHFTVRNDGLVGSFFGVFSSPVCPGPAHNHRCSMTDESASCNLRQLKIRRGPPC
jgi:hypothetical protein